jgi:hypothetical protein
MQPQGAIAVVGKVLQCHAVLINRGSFVLFFVATKRKGGIDEVARQSRKN